MAAGRQRGRLPEVGAARRRPRRPPPGYFPEPSGVPSVVTPSPEPPIRVFLSDGYWRVAYGSYMDGFHATRAEAIAVATRAADSEHRELEIEATG